MTVDHLRTLIANHGGIVGEAGAALILGLTPNAVKGRRERGSMPKPIATDHKGRPLWLASQVQALIREPS